MPTPPHRRPLLALTACAAVLALAGCAREVAIGNPEAGPRILSVSPVFQSSVQPAVFRERIRSLTRAIERLRDETRSGWTGRQDDVTGYLAELKGGLFFGGDAAEIPGAFLDAWGPELFGLPGSQVSFAEEEGDDGLTVLRGTQRVGGVPVLDAGLVATVAKADEDPRLSSLRGRVFPDISVSTDVVVDKKRAIAVAEESSGGVVDGKPRVVIMPVGEEGTLAWELRVVGGGQQTATHVALYYVDAVRGVIVGVRPDSAEAQLLFPTFGAPATRRGPTARGGPVAGGQVESVSVTGTGPAGDALTGSATRSEDGSIVLVDTSTPIYDPATGQGAVEVHDATGLGEDEEQLLPGPLATTESETVGDPEALGVLSYTRQVLDYYFDVHDRRSWDGQGGSFIGSIHFGDDDFCNAFFNGTQMVYGRPCIQKGKTLYTTVVDIDTVGHEITHGVTDRGSGLAYIDQSGALNESFSDYFGNVIGNLAKGIDGAELFEDGCDLPEPSIYCQPSPEGGLTGRYLLNGATMEDYIYLLDPKLSLKALVKISNDSGGVHQNSAIWNNALWSTRSRLAEIEGASGNDSAHAKAFDRAVYAADVRLLGPSATFLDARGAVEQAITELGLDPLILRVAREVFDLNKICQGCPTPPPQVGEPVAVAAAPQEFPAVSGERVAWIDLAGSFGFSGNVVTATIGGDPRTMTQQPSYNSVAFAGDMLLATGFDENLTQFDRSGVASTLDSSLGDCLLAGVAGSAEGAAWLNCSAATVNFVDPAGAVTSAPIGQLLQSPPVAIGTGGGTVAIGTKEGDVIAWRPGSDPEVVKNMGVPVLAVDAQGDHVIAVANEYNKEKSGDELYRETTLFNLESGEQTVLSYNATGFGVALTGDYAIWNERVEALGGKIAEDQGRARGAPSRDTDMWLYSFQSGKKYTLGELPGQQGYPDVSGNRLVWQDPSRFGQDVYTALIPSGL